MGAGINSPLDEYFPGVSADKQVFIYTRLKSNRTVRFLHQHQRSKQRLDPK